MGCPTTRQIIPIHRQIIFYFLKKVKKTQLTVKKQTYNFFDYIDVIISLSPSIVVYLYIYTTLHQYISFRQENQIF